MTVRKTFYPQKTFDDTFSAFVEMCSVNNWEFPGITLECMQQAVMAQRAERASHDSLDLEYRKVHQTFGQAQAERHALYSSALHAARGLFRNNKAVLAQLARFTSPGGGRRKKPVRGSDAPPSPTATQPPVTP